MLNCLICLYLPSLIIFLSLTPQVETIGDAYMVVGGLPERNTVHAECVANQGLDMMYYCTQVIRPDTDEPIRVSLLQCL